MSEFGRLEDEWKVEDQTEMNSETEADYSDLETYADEQEQSGFENHMEADKIVGQEPASTAQQQSGGENQAQWYVVHTYSGHENKVKANIVKIVENRNMQDLIVNIVVPTEETIELKNGQRKLKTRKIFPGYVIVKMVMTDESWYLVRNTQGVTGFVGHGSKPIPLSAEEVRKMGIERVRVEIDVDEGDMVRVINGPFESFIGTVEEVNLEKQTLKAKISMFGRETPVELEFVQIEKLS